MALGGHFEKTRITKIAQGWHLHTLQNLQTGGLGSSILQRKKLYTPSPGIPPWLPDYILPVEFRICIIVSALHNPYIWSGWGYEYEGFTLPQVSMYK